MKRCGLLLLLCLLSLSACVTAGKAKNSGTGKDLNMAWLDSVRQKIHEQKYPEAYQDVSFLERNPVPGITPSELAELKGLITQGLGDSFLDKVERQEYEDAYRRFCSLQGIGKGDLAGEWSAGRLLFLMAAKRAEAGEKPVALQYALRSRTQGNADKELLELLLSLAAELGNVPVYGGVLKQMESLGYPVPEAQRSRLVEVPAMEKMVRGTVTIWVNRGIKLEKGVGFPDRVIGSGFFIDKRGYLLTNYHVIASEVDPEYEGYSRLYIRLSDKVEEKIPAKVIGYDRIFDLALIKAEVTPDFVFSSGENPELKVGSTILAIGSPAGLENTVTSGIVSATGRRFLQMGDAIQVDVPINYGNSGGPLLDSSGQLVGVVFAGIEQFEGVNFAIPFDWINKALPRLYRGGEARHPWLGLAMHETESGLEVIYTVPGGPAQKAGLEQGDILQSLNGSEYRKLGEIQAALLDLDYPCLVTLVWKRGGQTMSGVLSLAERPFIPIAESLKKDTRDNVLFPLFGMRLEKTGQFLWRNSYVIRRVLQGSIADETGLSKDDPLTIQGWKVNDKEHYAILQIYVKKRKSGFLESVIQMAAYLETDNFI